MSDSGFYQAAATWTWRFFVLGISLGTIKIIPVNNQMKLSKVCDSTTILRNYLKQDGNPDARLKNTGRFDSRNYPDNYPLLFCVSDEGAEILLKHGANPNIEFGSQTLLYKAYTSRNIVLMELLLKHGANPNHLTTYKLTSILHDAAARGKEEIVKLLLKNGADVNIKNRRKETPLDVAAKIYRVETVEILLVNGGVTNTELGSEKLSHLRKKLHKRKLKRYHRRLRKIRQQKQSSN